MESTKELEESQDIEYEMRKQAKDNNHKFITLQREFMVYPEVFYPPEDGHAHFVNSTINRMATEEIAKKTRQESIEFLEVGCGAGFIGISVALSSEKCHVWATDIIDEAVKNAKANAKLHGVESRFHAVKANVFDHEEINGRKFDMIYWNHPWGGYGTAPGTKVEPLMRSLLDPGYQGLQSYLSKAKEYLKESGRLIVTFSYFYGSEERFTEIASENGWNIKVVDEKKCVQEIEGKRIEHFTAMVIELTEDVK